MPLPMIHLAVAVQLAEADPRCSTAAFLLGSIAPDSIHMRPGSTRADKARTHLEPEGERFPDEAVVDALVNQYARSALNDFAWGYGIHVLTDSLWMTAVLAPWWAQVPYEPDSEGARALYYAETDQVDFNLFHNAPWRPAVWEKLAQAPAVDFPPFLYAAEIDGWRDRTLRWFTELKEEPGTSLHYYTDAIAQDFIAAASQQLADKLKQWDERAR